MATRWKIIVACLPVILLPCLLRADDIKLEASINRNNIYIGESVLLTVKVSGEDKPQSAPDLSAITNCSIKPLGSQSDSSFSIVIINGKVSRSGSTGRTYSYEITPSSMGTFKAGPITLAVNGRTITADGPSIQVTGVEKQDMVNISINASRESALVGESFDITLSIMLKRLPGQFADTDPLDPADPPILSIPFLAMNPLPGLEMPDIRQVLQDHLVRRNDAPGFAVNNHTLQSNDPFDFNGLFNFGGMREQRRARFMFNRITTDRSGNSYFEYSLKLSYTPKEEGSHTFGPAVFKGPIVAAVDESNRGIKKAVFAVGPAATVRVVPPPEEGRPSSYIGVIGSNINAEAEIDAQTCKVGDPLKLALSISGNINIENVNPPPLNEQANLTKNFKIYEDTIQTSTKDGKKIFTYTIRPVTSGTIELPPIDISYFDAVSRSYKTVRTLPIPVRANESVEIGAANIIETSTNRPNEAGKTPERNTILVAPVDMNPAGGMPSGTTLKRRELTILVAGPLLYLVIIGGMMLKKHSKLNEGPRNRRQAVNEAVALINKLGQSQDIDPGNSGNALCAAIRKYIANRFNSIEAGLTPSDVRQLLPANGIDHSLTKDLCDILERNFNSVYSSGSIVPANVITDSQTASHLIERIENEIKSRSDKSGRMNGATMPACLFIVFALIVLCFSGCPALADNPVEFQFMWNEANSRMASAVSQDDFMTVAAVYQKLADAGVRNGPVFYNMGTAFLMAKQYDQAINAFQRAERFSGSNNDIRHNMLLAVIGRERNPNASLPWYRVPLFWHYQLSMSSRAAIAVIAFAGIWLALTIRALGSNNIYKPLLYLSLITSIVIGSSVATSNQQEAKDSRAVSRIVLAPDNPAQPGKTAEISSPADFHKGKRP